MVSVLYFSSHSHKLQSCHKASNSQLLQLLLPPSLEAKALVHLDDMITQQRPLSSMHEYERHCVLKIYKGS